MRIALAVLLASGLALSVRADDPKPADPAKKDAPAATAPATGPAAAPAAPAAPKAIPVPGGEAVKKAELADGLIVEDLKIGDGIEVKAGWTVSAFYHGTLKADGKVFDSAFDRGEPATFPLDGVIEGWKKGVPGMKVGGIRRLTIPSKLGYGERGAGQSIPPNSDLVFIIQVTDAFGIDITDTKVGTGDTATGQCVAVTRHVIKTDDGKEVEKVDGDKMYIWFPGENQGMTNAFDGMKIGGKRTIKIPAKLNVAPPQLESTRPQNVPLTIEVELVTFRNLPGRK